EISVRHGVRRLLEFPQVLAESGDRRRRVEDDLRAIQPERASAFGKMAVVADVDPRLYETQIENRIPQITAPGVKILPESRSYVRDVRLAILAEICTIVVNHRGGVVIQPLLLHFVDRDDQREVVLPREVLHEPNGWTVRNGLCEVVPAGGLFGAEIR